MGFRVFINLKFIVLLACFAFGYILMMELWSELQLIREHTWEILNVLQKATSAMPAEKLRQSADAFLLIG